MTAPISVDQLPGPHGVPILGNLLDLNNPHPIDTLMDWARQYGPIYKLTVPGTTRIVVSGADLMPDICDDERFDKQLGPGLVAARGTGTPGLFLSETSDPLWRRAHNILMAPFSQSSMRGYLPRMVDIAGQLMDKWSRLNPDDEVNVPADMTALTLDTIALCGFGYRFNSLYRIPRTRSWRPWSATCWRRRRRPRNCRCSASSGCRPAGRPARTASSRSTWSRV
jgi:cytochrome P450/NADPH-cytochrome P450 reductase